MQLNEMQSADYFLNLYMPDILNYVSAITGSSQ